MPHGPKPRAGYFPCSAKRCDTCTHSCEIDSFISPWDQRKWNIRKRLTCTSPRVIYLLRCKIHPEAWYVGSALNLKTRWANHKSDVKLKKNHKCRVAMHMNNEPHPPGDLHTYMEIFAIDAAHSEATLGTQETWWMCNIGTIFVGLNSRKDLNSILRFNNRIQYIN